MRFLILSDLHLEMNRSQYEPPAQERYDAVILAGDIHRANHGIQWANNTFRADTQIFYVPGNHEYYGNEIDELFPLGLSQYDRVNVLNRASIELGGVRIHGAVLWTDYALYGDALPISLAMQAAQNGIADHRAIRCGDRRFLPNDARERHKSDVAWIVKALSNKKPGERHLVISHHLPSPRSIADKFAHSALNVAFASDIETLVSQADLWVHGHTHASCDYSIGECRVVANPAGYPLSNGTRENLHFAREFVVDVAAPSR